MTREEKVRELAEKLPMVNDLTRLLMEKGRTVKTEEEIREIVLQATQECIEAVVVKDEDVELITKFYNSDLHDIHDRLMASISGPISFIKMVYRVAGEGKVEVTAMSRPDSTVN